MSSDLLATGRDALHRGDWPAAREAFEAELTVTTGDPDAEALDGLARALWWLGDPARAVEVREQAYGELRRAGDRRAAARLALWLSREHREVHDDDAVADGWLARAERLLERTPTGAEHGWLALTRSGREPAPARVAELAAEALRLATEHDDPDLEIRSLARLGAARVSAGDLDAGMRCIDEAMAAATGGEAATPEAVGETMCEMFAAAELVGDTRRIAQWSAASTSYMRRYRHGSLVAFCGSCCAEVMIGTGALDDAERELARALSRLTRSGHRARCVHPAAKLAELRVVQGRYEEAARLLEGFELAAETVLPRAALLLASGRPADAAALLERRLRALGEDNLLSAPCLVLLAQARVGAGDPDGAGLVADRLAALAARSGLRRLDAEAERAHGLVALARGGPATTHLDRAAELFGGLRMPLEAARCRLLLAQALAGTSPEQAGAEATGALATFERLGAVHDADVAAALLRGSGGAGRSAPRGYGALSRREREVLDLVADGLTNAEIAARLFISVKTAGNHVSSILAKLGLRSRGEAAVYAVRERPN